MFNHKKQPQYQQLRHNDDATAIPEGRMNTFECDAPGGAEKTRTPGRSEGFHARAPFFLGGWAFTCRGAFTNGLTACYRSDCRSVDTDGGVAVFCARTPFSRGPIFGSACSKKQHDTDAYGDASQSRDVCSSCIRLAGVLQGVSRCVDRRLSIRGWTQMVFRSACARG